MSWTQYWTEVLRVLTLRDVVPAVMKTAVFGYLIGLVGCYTGYRPRAERREWAGPPPGAWWLSIFLVLVADVVLVKMIQLVTSWLG